MNVARALVGTEAACAIVLGATLNLIPNPPERALAIVGFQDVFTAAVPDVLETKPIGTRRHRPHAGRIHEEEVLQTQ